MTMWVLRSFALSPLDGASVREAHSHCEQASTAVREAHCAKRTARSALREAHCAQATVAHLKV